MKYFKRLAHAVCKYHIVWCPKFRFKVLKGDVGKSVRDIIKELCEWKKIKILEGNVQKDHIHPVLLFPPKYSISEVVGFLKGRSAIKIFDKYVGMKKRYRERHFWAKGYCVSTVGLDEEQTRQYMKWHLNKDKNITQRNL